MLKKWKLTPVSRGTADADWPAKKACLRPHEMKAWSARDHNAPPRFTIFAVRVAVSIKETRQVPENSTTDANGDTSVTPHLIGAYNNSIYRVTLESVRLLTLNFLVQPCRNFKSPGAAMLLARRAPVPSRTPRCREAARPPPVSYTAGEPPSHPFLNLCRLSLFSCPFSTERVRSTSTVCDVGPYLHCCANHSFGTSPSKHSRCDSAVLVRFLRSRSAPWLRAQSRIPQSRTLYASYRTRDKVILINTNNADTVPTFRTLCSWSSRPRCPRSLLAMHSHPRPSSLRKWRLLSLLATLLRGTRRFLLM